MEIFNALNLSQITGGTKLKQGDFGSVLSYSLSDENGQEITSFDTKTAYVNLVLDDKILFTTTTQVDISRVTFHIDKAIPTGLYYLEIKIDDYIFPSDKDSIILIEEGATAYDLKDLIPNYDVAMTITTILSDLAQKGMNITDLQTKVNAIYDKSLADNAEIIKARGGQSSLSTRLDGLDAKDANLQAQITTNISSITSTNNRVDNIIASSGNGTVPSELTDIRVGADGVNYVTAGKAVREQFSNFLDILSEVSAIAPNFVTKNLLKNIILKDGKFIVPSTGSESGNPAFSATDYIPILKTKEYYFYLQKQTYGAWYDTNKNYISGISYNTMENKTILLTPPAEAMYIRLSYNTTEKDSFILKENITEQPFLDPTIRVSSAQIVGDKVLKVKTDGSGDFTTLKSAFASISDSSPMKKYLVEFYGNGNEYDVVTEFTSTDGTVGLMVPAYTKLVGIGGRDKNILVSRLPVSNQNFSTLNLYASSQLEGFTVIGKNTRYAVHDDFYSEIESDSDRVIKDCNFISEGTYYKRPYGAGIRSGCQWLFENCIFLGQGSDETAYSCHNNSNFKKPSKQHFKNCRFKGGSAGSKVRFGSITSGANGIINDVIFEGCLIGSLTLSEEKADTLGRGILFNVSGYANDIKTGTIIASDGVDYKNNIDLI